MSTQDTHYEFASGVRLHQTNLTQIYGREVATVVAFSDKRELTLDSLVTLNKEERLP